MFEERLIEYIALDSYMLIVGKKLNRKQLNNITSERVILGKKEDYEFNNNEFRHDKETVSEMSLGKPYMK